MSRESAHKRRQQNPITSAQWLCRDLFCAAFNTKILDAHLRTLALVEFAVYLVETP